MYKNNDLENLRQHRLVILKTDRGVEGMPPVVQQVPSKHRALSSNPSTASLKKKKERKEN
jgi:hypothetical protein